MLGSSRSVMPHTAHLWCQLWLCRAFCACFWACLNWMTFGSARRFTRPSFMLQKGQVKIK